MVVTSSVETGHNATIAHQRAIKRLIVGLDQLQSSFKVPLEALPETDIDPGNPESKCPDVILRDNTRFTVPVIIEVATNMGAKTDFKKMKHLIDTTEYGIEEGFVYNFEANQWTKYSKQNTQHDSHSWSDVLGIDLAPLIATNVSL